MRYKLAFITIIIFGCSKQHIATGDVIYGLSVSPSSVDADGSSLISVTVHINKDADPANRKVTLTTTSGSFTSNGTKEVTVDAVYENRMLTASAMIKAPASPGTILISARPATSNPYNDFIITDSVTANASEPATVHLEPSAFSVSTAFLTDVEITGTLKNDKHKNVSTGNTVLFEGYLVGGAPLDGRFRSLQVTSNENSQVSAVYSPGNISTGTDFYIRCTVLKNGIRTPVKDSVLIAVVP